MPASEKYQYSSRLHNARLPVSLVSRPSHFYNTATETEEFGPKTSSTPSAADMGGSGHKTSLPI